jgi:hypothetical protein
MIKIVSGGQTGVDRAALDVALKLDIPCGGWCPKGRLAADGIIPVRYPLKETTSATYSQRTRRNIEDSDATLVLTYGTSFGGTALTIQLATEMDKPLRTVDMNNRPDASRIRRWIRSRSIKVLNVAGPRENRHEKTYERAVAFLEKILASLSSERISRKEGTRK